VLLIGKVSVGLCSFVHFLPTKFIMATFPYVRFVVLAVVFLYTVFPLCRECVSRDNEPLVPALHEVRPRLLQVIEQQSEITKNISFDFQSMGYRAVNGKYRLSYTDNGNFHLGDGGERSFSRVDRKIPETHDTHNSSEKKIQVSKSFEHHSLVIEDKGSIIFNTWLDKKMTKEDIISTSGFQPVFGVVMRYRTDNGSFCVMMLKDFVQNADISFEESNEDTGRDLVRATMNVDRYRVDVWFDPALNFALKRIRQEISQITGGKQLISSEINVTSHKIVDGIYLPKEFCLEERRSAGRVEVRKGDTVDVPALQDKFEYTIDNFFVDNRRDDFRIVGIPDGTPVFVEDSPQIARVWFDGEIIVRTDELMMQIARGGHKFMPGPDSPRFWFMTIGIMLFLLGCGKLAYDRFKKENGGV